MSISITNSSAEPRSFSIGPVKVQLVDYVANSGATSGTVTADKLSSMSHILLLGGKLQHTAAPTFSANVATLAFAVAAETAASLIVQDLTYTAVANLGAGGNSITIAYVAGGTAGAEVVTVTGNAISVSMETTVSTATQVKAAIDASAAAIALVSVAVTGTGSTAQVAAAATALAGGVYGGGRGTALCVGR
jgi:hypothetical protein